MLFRPHPPHSGALTAALFVLLFHSCLFVLSPLATAFETAPGRIDCLEPILRRCNKYSCTGKDVYAFGVFTGKSISYMAKRFPKRGGFARLWGFDSFQGIPDDGSNSNPDCAKGGCNYMRGVGQHELSHVGKDYKYVAKEWYYPGSWNVSDVFGTSDFLGIIGGLDNIIDDGRVNWVRGFYNESLTSQTFALLPFRPALFVDLDCDLYSSTKQALEWLLDHNIVVPGTVIYYDDWSHGGPDGQQKAHAEVMRKYGLEVHYRVGSSPEQRGRMFREEMVYGDNIACVMVTKIHA